MQKRIKIGITGHKGVLGKEFRYNFQDKFRFYKFNGDITNKKNVETWVKTLNKNNVKKILHFAAKVKLKKNQKEEIFMKVNKDGTKNLLDGIEKYYSNPPWIFIASTCQVYKSQKKNLTESDVLAPINMYSKSKLQQELIINRYPKLKYNICIGRIFSYTSKFQGKDFFIPSLFTKLNQSKNTINLFGSNKIRDFLYSIDVIKIIYKLMIKNATEVINIGSGNPTTIKEIATYMKNRINKEVNLIFLNDEDELSYVCCTKKLRKYFKIKRNFKTVIGNYLKNAY